MAITKTRTPYEFLARWDHETGAFKGAHIQFYDTILDGGVVVSGGPSKAYGVGDGLAFPLADIVSQMTATALADATDAIALRAERAQLRAELKAVSDELRDLKTPPTLVRYGHLRKSLASLDLVKRWDTAIAATVAALTTAGDEDPKRIVAWWESDSPAPINSIGPDWAAIIKEMKWPAGVNEAALKAKITEVQAAAAADKPA